MVGKIISLMKSQRLLQNAFTCILVMVRDTTKKALILDKIQVVNEFSDVFPDDLPRLHSNTRYRLRYLLGS